MKKIFINWINMDINKLHKSGNTLFNSGCSTFLKKSSFSFNMVNIAQAIMVEFGNVIFRDNRFY